MKLILYQLDAFTNKLFGGNPAAVCPLDEWIDEELMQNIALENNLSETAFFVPKGEIFEIRWFTPKVEIMLAGHPTLATAYIIFNILNYSKDIIEFNSKSGPLYVSKEKDILWLDFPTNKPSTHLIEKEISDALGKEPIELYKKRNYIAVYESQDVIKSIKPNFEKIKELDSHGIIITSEGDDVDFVSRFFAPSMGVNEDPVTGSAHTELIPLWTEKLGKDKMIAHQISERKGELYCENHGNRVKIGGKAKLYMKAEIFV